MTPDAQHAEQKSQREGSDLAVGNQGAESRVEEAFTLEREDCVRVHTERPSGVEVREGKRRNRHLGVLVIQGKRVKVWFSPKRNALLFRTSRRRKVEEMSLTDAFFRAAGQMEYNLK